MFKTVGNYEEKREGVCMVGRIFDKLTTVKTGLVTTGGFKG